MDGGVLPHFGFKVRDFHVLQLGCRVQGSQPFSGAHNDPLVYGSRIGAWVSGFRVQGLGFKVLNQNVSGRAWWYFASFRLQGSVFLRLAFRL